MRVAAELLPGAERPAVDQLARDMVVARGGVEQVVGDGHRHRRREQRDPRDAIPGWRAAQSSTDSEPSEWPTSAASRAPAASSTRGDPVGDRLDIAASAGRRPSGRGRAGRPRARCIRGARNSATAAPRRCGRWPRRARTRSSAGPRSGGRVAGVGVDARVPRDRKPHRRGRQPCPPRAAPATQVLDQVVGILEADRQADRALGDPRLARGPRPTSGNASSTPDGSRAISRRRRWRGARRGAASR